jgi:hypothetical protein
MSPFTTTVEAVLDAASTASAEQFQNCLSAVVDLVPTAGTAERHAALHRFADALTATNLTEASLLALGCGAIVEHGGDPLVAIDAILARLPSALSDAAKFHVDCLGERDRTGEPPSFFFRDEPSVTRNAEPGMRNAEAWDALEPFCRGAITMLARSPEARGRARNQMELRDLAARLTADHDYAAYLSEILDVLDDEDAIILHPEEKLGFRVRIRGIADNFQLHTLLAAELIGDPFDGWISGRPIPPRVAAAARDKPASDDLIAEGRFGLFQWRGLQLDGSLPPGFDGSAFWLWGEGRPADIERFEEMRVVLLGPPAYVRTWNAARRFDAMPADLSVVEKLPRAEVDDWLRRITSASRET